MSLTLACPTHSKYAAFENLVPKCAACNKLLTLRKHIEFNEDEELKGLVVVVQKSTPQKESLAH